MSSTGIACLGRIFAGSLRAAVSRASLHHVHTRNFYLQSARAATIKINMPSLSPTMETGTIVKWHKKEGDAVAPGDILCEIQTDKAVVAMEADEEGTIAKILKPENTKDVQVGTLIALMVEEGDDWKSVVVPSGGGAAATPTPAATPATPASEEAAAPSGGATMGIKVNMPSLSPTMEAGTIVKWHKKEGDKINAGDVLCDIQTDKAVVGMEYDDEGVLAKILKPDNSTDVKVGSLIALLVEEGQDWKDVQIPVSSGSGSPAPKASKGVAHPKPITPAVTPVLTPAPTLGQVQTAVVEDLPLVGPSVKKLLHEYNLAASVVKGSGPKGNLLKGDVLTYISSNKLQKVEQTAHAPPAAAAAAAPASAPRPASGQPYIDIPLSNMRKIIAKRLTESKTTVPHAYATIDCSMKTITNTRKRFVERGIKVSVNDFIIKAAGYALERSPKVNAVNNQGNIQTGSRVDISIAVATEGGLITPIVVNVPGLDVGLVAQSVKALADKARAGQLQPHEFQGGTFTISNLGMFGIKEFSAVINPPQVAILAIGSTRLTVGDDNTIVDPKMAVTLSYDSRAMDEWDATQFLELFRLALEHPEVMLGGLSERNEDFAFGTAV